MRSVEVSEQLGLADSTQQEAVENIFGANLYQISPEAFKEHSGVLKDDMKQLEVPPLATPTVAEEITRSPSHASAIKPDVEKLNWIETQFSQISDRFSSFFEKQGQMELEKSRAQLEISQSAMNVAGSMVAGAAKKVGPEQELNALHWKKLKGQELTEEEELDLASLRYAATQNFGYKDYGLTGPYETLPADVFAQMADLPAMMWRNKELIGSITGSTMLATGGTGAAIGSVAGGVGAIPGAVAGAKIGLVSGLTSGYLAASFYDSFRNTAASTYGDLDQAVDDKGKPLNIDETNKRNLALGVGVLSGTVSAVGDKFMMKSIPWLRDVLTPGKVKALLTQPGNEQMRNALIGIGRAMAGEGAEEMTQEVIQIMGEEIGHTFKEGKVSFINGLMNAAEKLSNDPKIQGRVGRAGLVGAAAGGTFAGTGAAVVGAASAIGEPGQFRELTDRDIVRYRRHLLESPDTKFIPMPSDIPEFNGTPDFQAVQVLEFQDVIDASSKVMQSTGLHNLSPEESSRVRARIVENAGIKKVWFDKQSLQEFAKDEERGQAVRDMFVDQEIQALENNASASVPVHRFLDMVDKYPELSEYMRLNPVGPSPKDARVWHEKKKAADQKRAELKQKFALGEKSPEERAYALNLTGQMGSEQFIESIGTQEVADAYLGRLQSDEMIEGADKTNIQSLRERVTAIRDQLPKDQDSQAILRQALDTPEVTNDIFGQDDYLNRPTITEAIKSVMPDAQIDAINKGQRAARNSIVEAINSESNKERENVIDIVELENIETQRQIELDKIANDPNIEIVEKFLTSTRGTSVTPRYTLDVDTTASHWKKGFSLFAIDPNTLTEAQKKKYLKDPRLKKYKVFVRGGLSADDAGMLIGVNNGDNLLDIMSKTPTREEVAEMRVEERKKQLRKEAEDSVDLNKTAITKAYHNMTYNHLQELKFMLAQDWSSLKKGIKRIALRLPRIEELTSKARLAVSQTKVADLNANKFRAGERRSEKIAVESILKNNIQLAFQAKEAAALNSELTIATRIAIIQVNRVQKLARKLERADNRAKMKEAGVLEAFDELVEAFDLTSRRSKKSVARQNAYQELVDKMVKRGHGNFQIHDRLSDLRESIQDMTVEQVLFIGDRLRMIEHSANIENKLQLEYGTAKDIDSRVQTREATIAMLSEHIQKNEEYNEKKSVTLQRESMSNLQYAAATLRDLASNIKNMEHIIYRIDNQAGGILNEAIVAPLNGVGKYTGMGRSGKINDMIVLKKAFEERVIQVIGKDEWQQLHNTEVFIPEFEKSKKLNHGRMTKGQLFAMMLNLGNDGNIDRLVTNFGDANFTTDIDTIRAILDREMDNKFAVAAQNVMDMYASYFPRVSKLHEDMAGVTPEFVEAKAFVHKGIRYPGGYYPIMYQSEMNYEKIVKTAKRGEEILRGETQFHLEDHYYADDMTKHNHTERRKGSDQSLDLSLRSIGTGFEAIIHDLNFRRPISDAIKILTDPKIAKDISSVVGVQDFNVIVNTVVEASQSVELENSVLFDSTKPLEKIAARGRSSLSAAYLLGKWTSIAVQPTSFVYAVEQMGAGGVSHVVSTLEKMLQNPHLAGKVYELAAEMNPSIRSTLQDIDDTTRDAISKLMPQKNRLLGKKFSHIDLWRQVMNEKGFQLLGKVDQLQKVIVTISAYNQFMSGDAPGVDLDTVMKMKPEERDHQAKTYATSVARLTLTAGSELDKSPFQKQFKTLAMFMNDPRNIINNTFRQGRDVRKALNRGDYGLAGRYAMAGYATMLITNTLLNIIRGNPTGVPLGEEAPEEWDEQAQAWMKFLARQPYDVFAGNIPVVKDIKFGLESVDWNSGRVVVNTPLTKLAGSIGDSIYVAYNMMEYINDERDFSKRELKSLGQTSSFLFGGHAVNAMFDAHSLLEEGEDNFEEFGKSFRKQLERLKKTEDDAPAELKMDEESMKALESFYEILEGQPSEKKEPSREGASVESSEDPETYMEAIKQIESGGNVFAKNPNSTASGLYQFLEGTWEDIMERAPELELTPNGRVSANPEQQEKAMKWFTQQNINVLKSSEIEINAENVYAAHFLGARKAVEVLKRSNDAKMKTVVSQEVMDANNFKNSMKVKDFKKWLSTKVNRASEKVAALDKQES